MTECLLGVAIGCLLCLMVKDRLQIPSFGKKPQKKAREPTEDEIRQAKRAAREYLNFMTYDGTPQEDIID